MLRGWLKSLREEHLLTWSSRGQLRRAGKLADSLDDGAITLDDDRATGRIDGHEQALEAVGFEAAVCSCPATGQCHHLVAFLLALSHRAGEQASQDGDLDTAPVMPYWRAADDAELLRALGRANVRAAQRAMAEAVDVDCDEGATELVATIDSDQPVTVRLPATGGLAVSVCSCKRPSCMHRALAVLTVRARHGLLSEAHQYVLDDAQAGAVDAAQSWVLEITGQGLSGLTALQLVRGQALATELRQADLPRPGRTLDVFIAQLQRHETQSPAHATADALATLAGLWMTLRALGTTPPPRPLLELAGSHRRRYRRRASLALLTLGVELWRTATGYRGFSLHLLDTADGQFFTFSEARGPGQDPTWNATRALASGAIAGRRIGALKGMSFILERAAVSADGRLALRPGSKILAPVETGPAAPIEVAADLAAVRASLAQAMDSDPGARPAPRTVIVQARLEAPTWRDPYRGQWLARACDEAGSSYTVVVDELATARRLDRVTPRVRALLGRVVNQGVAIELRPIVAYTARDTVALTVEEGT